MAEFSAHTRRQVDLEGGTVAAIRAEEAAESVWENSITGHAS